MIFYLNSGSSVTKTTMCNKKTTPGDTNGRFVLHQRTAYILHVTCCRSCTNQRNYWITCVRYYVFLWVSAGLVTFWRVQFRCETYCIPDFVSTKYNQCSNIFVEHNKYETVDVNTFWNIRISYNFNKGACLFSRKNWDIPSKKDVELFLNSNKQKKTLWFNKTFPILNISKTFTLILYEFFWCW